MKEKNNKTEFVKNDLTEYLHEISKTELLTKDEEVEFSQLIRIGKKCSLIIETNENSKNKTKKTVQKTNIKDPIRKATFDAKNGDLTKEQKTLLKKKIKEGEIAKEKFIKANLRLVFSIVKRTNIRNSQIMDIIQEGNLGLINAIDKFDERKGFKFSTYATWWIKQAVTKGIGESVNVIKIPSHVEETLKKTRQKQESMNSQNKTSQSLKTTLKEIGIKDKKASVISKHVKNVLSLSNKVYRDSEAEISETIVEQELISPEDKHIENETLNETLKLLDFLTEDEKQVILCVYGFHTDINSNSVEDIANKLGFSKDKIKKLESCAMSKMRHPSIDVNILQSLYET